MAHERLQGHRIPVVIAEFVAVAATLVSFWEYPGTPMAQAFPVTGRMFQGLLLNGVQLMGACANIDQAFLASRMSSTRLVADAERATMSNELRAFPQNFVNWLMQQNPVTYVMMERMVQACIHHLDVFEHIMVEPSMQGLQECLASIPTIVMMRQLNNSVGPNDRILSGSCRVSSTSSPDTH